MAHTASTHSGFSLGGRIRGFIEDVRVRRAEHAEYARTVAELEKLTTRELNDIGISRSDIHEIARKHVHGR